VPRWILGWMSPIPCHDWHITKDVKLGVSVIMLWIVVATFPSSA
jgi:hypothetical protein